MFDIITIGSATRDAIFKSKEFKTIENMKFKTGKAMALSLGSKIKIDDVYFTTGGAATNAAVTFSREKLKTAAIFRVGNDLSGKTVIEEMRKENIDTSFTQTDENLATAYSVILEEACGERTILSYRGANANLNTQEIPFNSIKTKWFYLTSLSGDLNLLNKVINNAKQNSSCVAWNPGGEDLKLGILKLLPYLKNINVFLVNQEEASELLNISYENIDEIFEKFDEIIDGIAIITKGPDGSIASDGKNIYYAGTFKEKEIVDRTGAGDSFGSGFVAGLIIKNYITASVDNNNVEKIKYALTLATANATSKVEHIGAKKGLLTKFQFENEERFKNLPIEIKKI